ARVKITDFGLARAVDDASVTQSGVIAGTPMYMSPEQAASEPVDHRSDLFSLGSVMYAMCTGHPPFRATGTIAVIMRVIEDTPRPIREINPDIPDWLEAIIAKLHAKKPEDRFQSAKEVAELLEQHLAHLQQPGQVPPPPSLASPAVRNGAVKSGKTSLVLPVSLIIAPLIIWAILVPTSPLIPRVDGFDLHGILMVALSFSTVAMMMLGANLLKQRITARSGQAAQSYSSRQTPGGRPR